MVHEEGIKVQEVLLENKEDFQRYLNLYEEYYALEWPEEYRKPKWRQRFEAHLRKQHHDERKVWSWILFFKEKQVGLAHFYLSGPEGCFRGVLEDLYIQPAYRNRKLGQRFFERIKVLLQNYQAYEIQVPVQIDQLDRIRFWEAMGFRIGRFNMMKELA